MKSEVHRIIRTLLLLMLLASPVAGAPGPADEGSIFTLWPLVDYRSSPKEGFSNLSLLGPLFKFQLSHDDAVLAVRPLYYREKESALKSVRSDYLYPLFSYAEEVLRLYYLQPFVHHGSGVYRYLTAHLPFRVI